MFMKIKRITSSESSIRTWNMADAGFKMGWKQRAGHCLMKFRPEGNSSMAPLIGIFDPAMPSRLLVHREGGMAFQKGGLASAAGVRHYLGLTKASRFPDAERKTLS